MGLEQVHQEPVIWRISITATALVLHIETDQTITDCPDCGVLSLGPGPGASAFMTSLAVTLVFGPRSWQGRQPLASMRLNASMPLFRHRPPVKCVEPAVHAS